VIEPVVGFSIVDASKFADRFVTVEPSEFAGLRFLASAVAASRRSRSRSRRPRAGSCCFRPAWAPRSRSSSRSHSVGRTGSSRPAGGLAGPGSSPSRRSTAVRSGRTNPGRLPRRDRSGGDDDRKGGPPGSGGGESPRRPSASTTSPSWLRLRSYSTRRRVAVRPRAGPRVWPSGLTVPTSAEAVRWCGRGHGRLFLVGAAGFDPTTFIVPKIPLPAAPRPDRIPLSKKTQVQRMIGRGTDARRRPRLFDVDRTAAPVRGSRIGTNARGGQAERARHHPYTIGRPSDGRRIDVPP